MKLYKPHKYQQPDGNKYCALYNIANVFNIDLEILERFKKVGIGTKDLEYIIKQVGYPHSYIAVMSNVIKDDIISKDSIEFIIDSISKYARPDEFLVLPTVIKLKNSRMHWIMILINENKILVSDPRKTHIVEVTRNELLNVLKPEQLSVLLSYRGFRKSHGVYINI